MTGTEPLTPTYQHHPRFSLAGRERSVEPATFAEIPDHWNRVAGELGTVTGRIGIDTFGACHSDQGDGSFRYLAGVRVGANATLPPGWTLLEVPTLRWAVFRHAANVAHIRSTMDRIWREWLPASGLTPAAAPILEHYGAAFDPATGDGGLEVWLPLAT